MLSSTWDALIYHTISRLLEALTFSLLECEDSHHPRWQDAELGNWLDVVAWRFVMCKVAEFGYKSLDLRCAMFGLVAIPPVESDIHIHRRHSCNCLDEVAACCLSPGLASITTLTLLDLRSCHRISMIQNKK